MSNLGLTLDQQQDVLQGMHPISPEDVKPGALAGLWKAPFTGMASVLSDIALVGASVPMPEHMWDDTLYDVPKSPSPEATEQARKDVIRGVSEVFAPDPRTSGIVSQYVHGFFNIVPEAIIGGPLVAAGLQGNKGYLTAYANNVDTTTALGLGLIDAAATWAGLKIPVKLAPKYGAAVNIPASAAAFPAVGMVSRGTSAALLEANGYPEMAAQYKWLDQNAIIADMVMGAGFGALAHYGPKAADAYVKWQEGRADQITSADRDTAATILNGAHLQTETAPGVPADPVTQSAHVDYLRANIESLMRGEDPPPPPPEVVDGNFVADPTATAAREQIGAAVREHLGVLGDLEAELANRGLPTDPTLYSVDTASPVRFTDRVRSILAEHEQTGDTATLLRRLGELKGDLESRVERNDAKQGEEPVRGEMWVRERLLRAERHGEISPEQHALARWLLDQNPALANDLAVSLRSSKGYAAGQYNPYERLVTLFKNRGDDMTAAHEILHHAERMMPEDVRTAIRQEWIERLQSLHDMASENGDTKLTDAISNALKAAAGDRKAYDALTEKIALGELPRNFYQFVNPSEYWAVNAARLVRDRAHADGWVAKAVQWMKELLQKAQSAFGLDSNAAVIRGLNAVLNADGTLSGRMLSDMLEGDFYAPRKPGGEDPAARVTEMLRRSAENENRTGVVVGGRPGEFGWSFSNPDATPPPIQAPAQRGPRLEKIAPAVRSILSSSQFKKLAKDLAGIEGLRVDQIEGTWHGNAEPSFVLHADNLGEAEAAQLAKILGFAFTQDATVVTKHSPDLTEGVPTVYMGSGKVLQKDQLRTIIDLAKERGLDLSTSRDQKAVKFMYFGDEAGLEQFYRDASEISQQAGLSDPVAVRTQGDLYEADQYLVRQSGEAGGEVRDQAGWQDSPDLFGRVVDHVLVPYAKAVAAEGYRLSPDRLAERFGLTDAQRELIRDKLRPRNAEALSTVPLMTGAETLDIQPTTQGKKGLVANVTDLMFALQNRAAKLGQIEPGDYSPAAMKTIAKSIVTEVSYHIQHAVKSAIGWYDKALKAAKQEYATIFPELQTDADRGLLFDAVLGITSQGNDVHANSVYATRIYQLVREGMHSIGDAVKILNGTFGNQTRAIELNLLKLEHLLGVNGYAHMRDVFNTKMTVGEWNARLRQDPNLYGPDGKPLSVEGKATQKVTGWMVFGPKIGSFINNLHGDYSTLTADLWFTRTWNRLLGFMFQHVPALEAKQYQEFRDAVLAEYNQSTEGRTQNGKVVMKNGQPVPWENGRDVVGMSREDMDALINDPQKMLALAQQLEERFRSGRDFEGKFPERAKADGKKSSPLSYFFKSDLRRRAKNWVQGREDPVGLPRTDLERDFQQRTVEMAQSQLKKLGYDISIADIQAALWFYEKELFAHLGVSDKKSAPADYADAARNTMTLYKAGELYKVGKGDQATYIGGDNGKYLGLTVPNAEGQPVAAVKLLEQADAEIAKAEADSPQFDAAAKCFLRG